MGRARDTATVLGLVMTTGQALMLTHRQRAPIGQQLAGRPGFEPEGVNPNRIGIRPGLSAYVAPLVPLRASSSCWLLRREGSDDGLDGLGQQQVPGR